MKNNVVITYIKAGASSFMMDMDELLGEFGIEADAEDFNLNIDLLKSIYFTF